MKKQYEAPTIYIAEIELESQEGDICCHNTSGINDYIPRVYPKNLDGSQMTE